MKEGIDASTNEFIIFLDADIDPYPEKSIEKLAAPLLNDEADFVKGAFARNAGTGNRTGCQTLTGYSFSRDYRIFRNR